MGKRIRINISIDENILGSLDYFAKLNGMNRSAYITKLITDVMWESDEFYRSNALPQESAWIQE